MAEISSSISVPWYVEVHMYFNVNCVTKLPINLNLQALFIEGTIQKSHVASALFMKSMKFFTQ